MATGFQIEAAANNDRAVALIAGNGAGRTRSLALRRLAASADRLRDAAGRPVAFGELLHSGAGSFGTLVVNGVDILLGPGSGHDIATLTDLLITAPRMYQDQTASNQNDGRAGVREKMGIIAAAVNDMRLADSSFQFSAEVWGDRLVINPSGGVDNTRAVVTTTQGGAAGPAISAALANVRYYALGITGLGPYQGAGAGNDDAAPRMATAYEAA